MAVASSPTPTAPTMNVAYINAFLEAICKVFSTMAGLKPQIEKPYVRMNHASTHDVSAVIGLSGSVIGSVVLTFSRSAANQAVTAFAGEDLSGKSADFRDAVGELVNMIAGAAKAAFPVSGASISLPTVVVDPDHVVSRPQALPTLIIPCRLSEGTFALEVSIKENTIQGLAR